MQKLAMLVLACALVAIAPGAAKKDEDFGTVIGIDLGATYSVVGVYKNGRVEIIPNDQGNDITPSYVALIDEDERQATPQSCRPLRESKGAWCLVGDAAKHQLAVNPENTIFDVKRLIGRSWDDPSVQRDATLLPFRLQSKEGKPHVVVTVRGEDKLLAPEEISAMVLLQMKAYLGTPVTHAVVTVPAHFNDAQRQATKLAADIAGLTVLRIVNEPTAAAIAYGLDTMDGERNIIVLDLSDRTVDASLLAIEHGVFEVLATAGDTHLGGDNFDQRVIEHFIKLHKTKTGKDVRADHRAVQTLRLEVEKARRTLATQHQTRIEIKSFFDGDDFSETLTRALFEELNMDLFRNILTLVQKVLDEFGMKRTEVDEIVLSGGSSSVPMVQQLVREFFNGKQLKRGIDPDLTVAHGAAKQAGVLGGSMCRDYIPEVILDVSDLSLGIETIGGTMTKLIPRHSFVPTKKSRIFSATTDDQHTVTIKVFEGERALTTDNHLLGTFALHGIAPTQPGLSHALIEVTVEIDVNGIIVVSAEDKASGSNGAITITPQDRLMTPEDIEWMVNDAEKFADEDTRVKERIRHELEADGYHPRIPPLYGLRDQAGPSGSADPLQVDDRTDDDADDDDDDGGDGAYNLLLLGLVLLGLAVLVSLEPLDFLNIRLCDRLRALAQRGTELLFGRDNDNDRDEL